MIKGDVLGMINVENIYYQNNLKSVADQIDIKVFKNAKLLITGATGLIGSFVADFFVYLNQKYNTNIKIYAMSRSKEKMQKRFAYVSKLADISKNLIFIEHNVCNQITLDEQFDYIISAASNAHPMAYTFYPVETINTNILGIKSVLDFAMQSKDTKVLYTSTMEVYGNIQDTDAFLEDDYGLINYNEIRSGYPESKRVSEILCRSYLKEYGVKSIICRLGYVYGPTMLESDSKVIAQFIRNVRVGENIIMKSKGEQIRSYCYVADAVSGILFALIEGKIGEVYNVANRNSIISIKQMAELIATQNGLEVEFELPNEIEKAGFSKMQDAILDESKLRSLGWNPIYNMKDGIKDTLAILSDEK